MSYVRKRKKEKDIKIGRNTQQKKRNIDSQLKNTLTHKHTHTQTHTHTHTHTKERGRKKRD